jgi:hypothetical protein
MSVIRFSALFIGLPAMPNVTPPTSHFWLMIGNTPQGPFDATTIRSKLSTGEISSDTKACPLGSQTWLPVNEWVSIGSQTEISDRIYLNDRRRTVAPPPPDVPPWPTNPAVPTPGSLWPLLAGIGCVAGVATVIGVLLWWPFGSSGYDLSSRNLPKGTVLRAETNVVMADGTVTYTADLQVTGKINMQQLEVTETEVMEVTKNEPSKLKIIYVTDTVHMKFRIPNQPENDITDNGVFHGRSLIMEKNSGIWKQTLTGAKPTPAQARALQTERAFDDLYPLHRVKRGETWKIEGPRLRRLVGMSDALSFEGAGTGTFEDVVTKNNEQCALIHMQISIKARVLDEQNNEAETELSAAGYVYRSIARLCDVETEMTGQLKYEGTVVEQGRAIRMKMAGSVKIQGRETRR